MTLLHDLAATMPARELLIATQAGSGEQKPMETYDDLLVRVEERASGFGGMFIDKDGRLAIYLLEPSQLLAASAAIEAVFGSDRIPAAGVRALQGQYTVSQLKRWTERAAVVFESPGVTAIDLDEARNRVMIGVEDDSRTRAVERALSQLDVPREAFVIQVTKQIKPLGPESHN
jgi:hypothetical protein